MEIEAKLLVPDAAVLQQLAALPSLAGLRLADGREQQLRTLYLDTPDGVLAGAGFAARVRCADGRWEATCKFGGSRQGAVHRRQEVTQPLAAAPEFPLRDVAAAFGADVARHAGDAALVPFLETAILRHSFDLMAEDRGAVAELALDTVHYRAPQTGQQSAPEYEVEAELHASGNEDDLAAIVADLTTRFPELTPSDLSKLARGRAFLAQADAGHEYSP